MRAALLEPAPVNGHFYFCSASIGVTVSPKIGESTVDLLPEADIAMFRATASGCNRVAFYEETMHAEVKDRMVLKKDLVHALARSQIHLAVQSQVDFDADIVGAELLVRWTHPVRGAIVPVTFIPIAEENGFILVLGDWILRQACLLSLQLAKRDHRFPLSIDLSPKQFRQADFVNQVRAAFADTGAAPESLIYEVTEGLLIGYLDATILRMRELARLGICISLDDFGTGYSNLACLQTVPLYELKVDRSFIRDIPAKPDSGAIVQAVLSIARHRHLRIVAEDVETLEQIGFCVTPNAMHYRDIIVSDQFVRTCGCKPRHSA